MRPYVMKSNDIKMLKQLRTSTAAAETATIFKCFYKLLA